MCPYSNNNNNNTTTTTTTNTNLGPGGSHVGAPPPLPNLAGRHRPPVAAPPDLARYWKSLYEGLPVGSNLTIPAGDLGRPRPFVHTRIALEVPDQGRNLLREVVRQPHVLDAALVRGASSQNVAIYQAHSTEHAPIANGLMLVTVAPYETQHGVPYGRVSFLCLSSAGGLPAPRASRTNPIILGWEEEEEEEEEDDDEVVLVPATPARPERLDVQWVPLIDLDVVGLD
ncbi:hypothetical protein AnigIFM59636_003516 [Aspergillus niger]|nr:hypothetical protein AnigIFM59636_003516 [Aspergillus niger]